MVLNNNIFTYTTISEASGTDNLSLDEKCQKMQNSVGGALQEDIRQIEE